MPRHRSEFHSYRDQDGNLHQLTNADLQDAVTIKDQLVKANGHCNFHRLRRLMIADGIDKHEVKVCPGFYNLIKKYNYRYVMNNDSYVNSPKRYKNGKMTVPESVRNEIGQYNYAKRESQDMARNFNRLRRHITDTQIFRDQIAEALRHAKFSFNVSHYEKSLKTGNNVLLASFSDLHVGALVNTPQNKYDLKIAQQRAREYAFKLRKLALVNDVSDVYIANIGDMVEHVYMRFTQGFDTELNMSEQIVEAINIMCGFISFLYNELSEKGIKLHYTGIGGNHDRLNGNKKNSLYKDNVMTIVNAAVYNVASNMFKKDFFEYIKPDDVYRTHLNINGTKVKIVHGDLDNLNKADTLGNMSLNDDRNYKLLLGGHLHRYSVIEAGMNKYIVTSGSFKGPDDYSSKLGRISSVSQAAVIINPELGLSIQNVELH